ncbi:dephospho-CoA kinase [Arthrobacter stackebrandtii]|uniref:Dephospho-CoA kinase n=1 Tax=Arthrobacter stackebrandtii TaxID=272161 RepID=A0ABS4Z126_9MICC|nr:dephospho-CoA kinase [Arthrobacter stackebrandtii]MBP2414540.1 dephospho-CoA kinase [Arthrobacter stackebrandtii]PYH01652.1 dephospho-CoA kinase [Arthrobacter stackebrandtii]
MLSIGLTGGIAAGKSLLAARFRELGAVLIDADRLARDALAPGTPGLAAVAARFGTETLLPDGSLDRPRLGSIVFGDADARVALNAIVHPIVRAAAAELKAEALRGAGGRAAGGDAAVPGDGGVRSAIVVEDIPLLVETGQGARFHLVVVVQAPEEERVARMVRDRGMSEVEARSRLAAQASDAERAAAADVLIINDSSPEEAVAQLDALWHGRLLPFAANLDAGRPAEPAQARQPGAAGVREGAGGAAATAALAGRIAARLEAAVGGSAEHIGGPAGVGQPGEAESARLLLEVRLKDSSGADDVLPGLASAGWFPAPGSGARPGAGAEPVVLRSADPGLAAAVVVR